MDRVTYTMFREMWAGRKFICLDTGAELTIPNDVVMHQMYYVGNGFLDVGDGYYCRIGGNIEEVDDCEGVGYAVDSAGKEV